MATYILRDMSYHISIRNKLCFIMLMITAAFAPPSVGYCCNCIFIISFFLPPSRLVNVHMLVSFGLILWATKRLKLGYLFYNQLVYVYANVQRIHFHYHISKAKRDGATKFYNSDRFLSEKESALHFNYNMNTSSGTQMSGKEFL